MLYVGCLRMASLAPELLDKERSFDTLCGITLKDARLICDKLKLTDLGAKTQKDLQKALFRHRDAVLKTIGDTQIAALNEKLDKLVTFVTDGEDQRRGV